MNQLFLYKLYIKENEIKIVLIGSSLILNRSTHQRVVCRCNSSRNSGSAVLAVLLLQLTEADVSPVQGVAADYVLYGYDQVMMGSSRVNVSKTHQLLSLSEGMEV